MASCVLEDYSGLFFSESQRTVNFSDFQILFKGRPGQMIDDHSQHKAPAKWFSFRRDDGNNVLRVLAARRTNFR
jgi:hypothetical protein